MAPAQYGTPSPNEFHLDSSGVAQPGLGPNTPLVPKREQLMKKSDELEQEAARLAKAGDEIDARRVMLEAQAAKIEEDKHAVADAGSRALSLAEQMRQRQEELDAREAKLRQREIELQNAETPGGNRGKGR